MASIKSDITNRNISSSSFREIDVTDESFDSVDGESVNKQISLQEINRSLISRGLPPIDEVAYFDGQSKTQNQQKSAPRQPQSARSYFNDTSDSELEDIDNKIYTSKKSNQNQDKLSDGAKRRIEMLCGMVRNTRQVEVLGNQYELRTLKSKEVLDALLSVSKLDGTISLPFQTRKEFLARSLVKVAGTDINLFLGSDSIQSRIDFLDELEEPLIERLYREYTLLVNEVNASYGLNDPQVTEGVHEDIKK